MPHISTYTSKDPYYTTHLKTAFDHLIIAYYRDNAFYMCIDARDGKYNHIEIDLKDDEKIRKLALKIAKQIARDGIPL